MGFDFIRETPEFKELIRQLDQGAAGLSVSGITAQARPYWLAALARATGRGIVLIRPSSASLYPFAESARFFYGSWGVTHPVQVLPALSEDPYQDFPPSLETIAARMRCFSELRRGRPGLVVTDCFGLLKPFPEPGSMEGLFCHLEKSQTMERDRLLKSLAAFGYERADIISSHGEYAWRGGIVDVYSPWETYPVRIEFSGDEIASIREFDPSSQRSRQKVDHVKLPSLREFPADPEFIRDWSDTARRLVAPGAGSDLKKRIQSLAGGDVYPAFAYHSLIQSDRFVPFSEYLSDHLWILDGFHDVELDWEAAREALKQRHEELTEQNLFSPDPDALFPPELWERITGGALRIQDLDAEEAERSVRFHFQSVPKFDNKIPFFLEFLKKKQEERDRCFVFFSSSAVRSKFAGLLSEHEIPHLAADRIDVAPKDESVVLLPGRIPRGFAYPPLKILFFSEADVFTEERVLVSRPRIKPFVSDFRDLRIGNHIVHTDYGIGVFKGLLKMTVDTHPQEFMELHYRDDDKLFVPVEDLNLVQKYALTGTAAPVLSKLGTPQWERTKKRTQKAIEEMAKELLELYAERKASRGVSFSPGGMWSAEFDTTFEYQETEDQLRAIREITRDMESPAPMDRLLCGDVGYGKTEVAMRAAFKAVMDGKQVAVLCPTTVLASQHLQTFRNRMLLFPVRVEGLTRLKSRAAQQKILDDLRQGLVDIIIGTHRLLSPDVEYHELGLLVVDEEQRFGVKHKEKIKRIKANIDVLTMTATPIPRTLNMSLSGLRDISLIETPPKDRLAIHTVVTRFDRRLIASAVRKELGRGGQVYFIHNRIEDIDSLAGMLEDWVPEARVVTVHGQMSGAALEKRMLDFVQQKYNVLISTTIIENGIDIPLVNTLIVNRADRFGLAQLYQLRGRVGRSSRQAVSYFLVPPFGELSAQAKERLKALQEFSELGSGFRLAAKDLEIRGAGSFLGMRQHGYMEAVGFDYYMHLLEKTVARMKGRPETDVKSQLNLKVGVRIPESYLPQTNLRLNLYKRVSSAGSLEELDRIADEVTDRFGPPPTPVKNLFLYGAVKFLAGTLRIETLDRVGERLVFKFLPDSSADVSRLTALVKRTNGSITPQGVLNLRLDAGDESGFLDETIGILKELTLM